MLESNTKMLKIDFADNGPLSGSLGNLSLGNFPSHSPYSFKANTESALISEQARNFLLLVNTTVTANNWDAYEPR